MKDVKASVGGKEYSLLFNGRAMFQLRETHETESEMFEAVSRQDREGLDALCSVVSALAEQGELARRYEGHEPREIPTAQQIGLEASPLDCITLRNAVLAAVIKGFGRDIEEEEKDLGLAELEKKTAGLR